MAEVSYTSLSGFSRAILPTFLFNFSSDQESMLLVGRYAKPVLQNCWNDYCKGMNLDAGPVDAIGVTSKFLFHSLASIIVTLPAPRQTGEAHMALFIIPARPEDGPRRYFTLEVGNASAPVGTGTLWEFVPESKTDYWPIERATGIEPTPEAFSAAIEQLIEKERTAPGPAPTAPPDAKTDPAPSPLAEEEPGLVSRWMGKLFGK